ncbi:hypothetical protein B296_00034922 [Ensete ventricosum]|uniref:SAM-dependent MTase DRM-type domain-containing protein n=1 Tax=Ensete ventricosum TaxID=4639 RepID=A0A426YMT3_ENSVE|nr:hypothetical protein B296_00034922 [Ensete ventricosum]
MKKAKGTVVDGESSFSHSDKQQAGWEAAWQSKPNIFSKFEMSDPVFIEKEVPEQMTSNLNGNIHGILSRSPYFFFGNVVDVSRETWRRLSEFLYGAEPEFASCQFFSAFMRKEGYLHNLPSGRRFYILPKPPVTLGEVLPHTKRWWLSWDTRKQLGCINAETKVVQQVCEQLGKMMMDSQGMLSKEQQANVLHQCKTLNLMWVGQYKLSPIEPDQVEGILGYPRHHTRIWSLEPDERLRALKYSFQADTLGYYLSVLKSMFPDGIRVLSVYSGTGGAEVALHRLGIHLKCVISVEPSNINRRIIRRWWQYTGQSGELILVRGVEKLTTQMLENLIQKFGGFDLIIGGNPGPCIPGSSNTSILMGMGQNPFFEFVRVTNLRRRLLYTIQRQSSSLFLLAACRTTDAKSLTTSRRNPSLFPAFSDAASLAVHPNRSHFVLPDREDEVDCDHLTGTKHVLLLPNLQGGHQFPTLYNQIRNRLSDFTLDPAYVARLRSRCPCFS